MSELRKDLLIWVDLETTGLNNDFQMMGVHRHKILEIGMHITDANLNIIDKGFSAVIHHNREDLSLMNEFVTQMHEKSGLLDAVEKSPFSLSVVEKMAIGYLESHNIHPNTSPMCGNTIHFDRGFIEAQMPDLGKQFHFRNLDVSSFKELAFRQYFDIAMGMKKSFKHRGLDDIKESIEELKYYQQNLFIPQNNTPKKVNKPSY